MPRPTAPLPLRTMLLLAFLTGGFSTALLPAAAPAKVEAKPVATKQATQGTSAPKNEAKKPSPATPAAKKKLEGHSYHGEVFNEGPRQKAYLMGGTGKVHFPCTSKNPEVQRFIDQGVGQLHGFWYFEAERSFRQAAALDPDCAIAYWGMAMANIENWDRAKKFVQEALKRKKGITDREAKYLNGLDSAQKAKTEKARAEQLTKAFEEIAIAYPNDLEAKAFLAVQMWRNRNDGVPIQSMVAVDALLKQILAVEPMHPCHHYMIHLWDYEKPAFALESAARGGQAAPAIAHMWHMPGHTYSRLNRYHDAIWQQEASARVDHAHMIRDRVLPDQIHNFAHNNEWLIRNLMFVGQYRQAIDLAKNMTELPRHPRYNTLAKRSSTSYGRQRLFEVLERFELWDEALGLAMTPYLEPTDDSKEQTKRLRLLARAHYAKKEITRGDALLADLEKQLADERQKSDRAAEEAAKKVGTSPAPNSSKPSPTTTLPKKPDAQSAAKTAMKTAANATGAKAEPAKTKQDEKQNASPNSSRRSRRSGRGMKTDEKNQEDAKVAARKPFAARISELEKVVRELQGWKAWAKGDSKEALAKLKGLSGVDAFDLASMHLAAGNRTEALRVGRNAAQRKKNEVLPLARLCDLLLRCNEKEEARKKFQELRTVATTADLDAPALQRLAPLAAELKLPADWRTPHVWSKDTGVRPDLATLGPFRWSPYAAPSIQVKTPSGESRPLFAGSRKPTIVIFYLGSGCLHCMQQLQAFAPKIDEFEKAGIAIVAISSDAPADLQRAYSAFGKGKVGFPHLSDASLEGFKSFRCYDDFEKQALHGTFLIDAEGRVRWKDISYEPFMNADFLLKESKRLLKLGGGPVTTASSRASSLGISPVNPSGSAENAIEAPRPRS